MSPNLEKETTVKVLQLDSKFTEKDIEDLRLVKTIEESSLANVVFNITKNGLGICALFLGAEMAKGGILFASPILAFICVICAYTFYVVGAGAGKKNLDSYKQLFEYTFGEKYGYILSFIIIALVFLVTIIYLIVIGEFMSPCFKQMFTLDENIHKLVSMIIVGFVIAIPCSFLRKVSSFQYGSLVGLIGYLYVAILHTVIYSNGLFDKSVNSDYNLGPGSVHILRSFGFMGVVAQSFTCHYNANNFFDQCGRNEKKFKNATIISFSLMFVINMIIALTSYLSYGNNLYLEGYPSVVAIYMSATKEYPELLAPAIIALVLVGINMAIGFGLTLFPTRIALNEIYQRFVLKDNKSSAVDMSFGRHVSLTSLLCVVITLIASMCVYFEGFQVAIKIVSFACSTSGPCICFIFPAFIYIKVFEPSKTKKILAYILVGFGILTMVAGLIELGADAYGLK